MYRKVQNLVLKDTTESGERIAGGRMFQHLGPAVEKARSPKHVFNLHTYYYYSSTGTVIVIAISRFFILPKEKLRKRMFQLMFSSVKV